MLNDQQKAEIKDTLVANRYVGGNDLLNGIDLDEVTDNELVTMGRFVERERKIAEGVQCPCGLKHSLSANSSNWSTSGAPRVKPFSTLTEAFNAGIGTAQERDWFGRREAEEGKRRTDLFAGLTANMSDEQRVVFYERNQETPTAKLEEMHEFFGGMQQVQQPPPAINYAGAQGVVGNGSLGGLTGGAAPSHVQPLTPMKMDWGKKAAS